MHPDFRWFVDAALGLGARVMVRTNLTILLEPGYTDLPAGSRSGACTWWRACRATRRPTSTRSAAAGLRGVDRGACGCSTRRATACGRPAARPRLQPRRHGPARPQAALEADYRQRLAADWGVPFTRLLTITNMPIGRFARDLERTRQAVRRTSRRSRTPSTPPRSTASCAGTSCTWPGTASSTTATSTTRSAWASSAAAGAHIRDFTPAAVPRPPHRDRGHCFGCTAGAGSSCGGALGMTPGRHRATAA